jgi:predicted DNA-binding transcriptional regulator YafY
MSNVERIYWLDAQIREGLYPNVEKLMERYGIKLRTARDDAAYLKNRLRAPLRHNRRYGGWEYTDPFYPLPFLALSVPEADTLRRTLDAALTYLPPGDGELVRQLAAKLSPYIRGLPRPGIGLPASVPEVFAGAVALAEGHGFPETLLADLRRALERRQRVFLRYYSAHSDETTERTVRPHSFLDYRGEIYLIAFCELRQAFRDFFLPRILEYRVEEPEGAYRFDPSFALAEYVNGPFMLQRGQDAVTVRVRFTPYQARWVRERVYHPSQRAESCADGSLILTLTVPGTQEITRWILSFGAEAEVLEPESLRQSLRETFARCARVYGSA